MAIPNLSHYVINDQAIDFKPKLRNLPLNQINYLFTEIQSFKMFESVNI